jgi:hypothetical protein
MVKSCTILMVYCLAIHTIFQVAGFPTVFEVEKKGPPSEGPISLTPLVTIEDIEACNEIKDKAEQINCLQQIGVEQARNLLNYANITVEEVDELVRQSQIAIAQLQAQSRDLDLEKLEFTNNFITKFKDAKSNLLAARRDLVTLASETVLLCDNIEILIADWQDKHAIILLNTQFDNLRRLVEKTKTRLSSARGKYAALIDTFLTMNENIELFKTKLHRASDKNSAEFRRWSSAIRATYISGNSVITVGMVIADIFGCYGVCSATVSTTTWAATAATAEVAINKYRGEIEALEDQVDNAIKHLKKLDQSTEGAVELITDEMNLVIRWQAAADNVENTINDFSLEQLQAIRAFQSIFANSISKLKNAAQGFYDFASSEKPVLEG